jgi:hypothetical protein
VNALQIRAAAERVCTTAGDDGDVVDLELDHSLALRELDAVLGLRSKLPRFHPDVPSRVLYRVHVSGAPATCAVIVGYAGDGTVVELLLRRDRRPGMLHGLARYS